MRQLANMPDYHGETVVQVLERMQTGPPRQGGLGVGGSLGRIGEGEDEMRRKMLQTLLSCGADLSAPALPPLLDEDSSPLGDMASPYSNASFEN